MYQARYLRGTPGDGALLVRNTRSYSRDTGDIYIDFKDTVIGDI